MTEYLIAVGSNIDPKRNVPRAITKIKEQFDVRAVSRTYRTAPTSGAGSAYFHNAGVVVASDSPPPEMRDALRQIEAELGRVRTADRNAPRPIDLDIVAIAGMSGEVAEGLTVPDPTLMSEAFVLVPLAEVAPEWEYEPGGATLQELRSQIAEGDIRPVSDQPEPFPARYAPESSMEATAEEVYDAAMEADVRSILVQMGEDPEREGLMRTPLRVAKAFDFLTSGYSQSLGEVVNQAIFESDTEEMVMVKDIEFYSLCEHHMLPFFGKAHVAYLPDQRIIGLSKVARIVDLFSRRLQVQERLTGQVADAIIEVLQPHGVAVVMEGAHFCMMMRGVQKQGSSMVTSAMRGGFKTDARTRSEFLELIKV